MPFADESAYSLRALDESLLDEVYSLEKRNLPNPWSRELLRAEFYKEISRTLGLFCDGKLQGYSFAHLIGEEFHILTLCIDGPQRGSGLGRLLLEQTISRAKREGASKVWLEVRESNSVARKLYGSIGFVERFIRSGYYSDTGEDAVVLERAV
jgi:[ribosomal protein S18]-alanine N-acetyltransferase